MTTIETIREDLRDHISKLTTAYQLLNGGSGDGVARRGRPRTNGNLVEMPKRKHRISAKGRAAIRAAAKLRWDKWKAKHKKKSA